MKIKLRKGLNVEYGKQYYNLTKGEKIEAYIDTQVNKHINEEGRLKKQVVIKVTIS